MVEIDVGIGHRYVAKLHERRGNFLACKKTI